MRLTFLSHFVICLACAAGAFFAWRAGVFSAVWTNDQSLMTSVIGVLFVGTAAYLGRQAWAVDTIGCVMTLPETRARALSDHANPSFGYLAAELCLILGVIGMAGGLAIQGKAISAGGNAVFGAWATQLSATIVGCVACAILLLMSHNVEAGARRR